MQIVIEIPESDIPKQQDVIEIPLHFVNGKVCEAGGYDFDVLSEGHDGMNGTSLTADELAYALMDERIMGELKQDISYSKDVIPDVKCVLNVSIQDHRPCYCGAGLREVWRESEVEE